MDDALYDRIVAAEGAAAAGLWSHYDVLGLPPSATAQEIKRAYRRLALRFHPDKADDAGRYRAEVVFRAVAAAYEVLSDAERRLRYDAGEGVSFEASVGSPFEVFARTFFEMRHKTDSDTRSPDWTLHKLSNYEECSLADAPEHMHSIVQTGLNYLAKALDLERQTVVLLRHSRIDIMWVMLAFDAAKELNQERFAEDGYPITYYDNPLQPGITPNWSDQNMLGKGKPRDPELVAAKELTLEEYIERKELARLELEAVEREERRSLRGG